MKTLTTKHVKIGCRYVASVKVDVMDKKPFLPGDAQDSKHLFRLVYVDSLSLTTSGTNSMVSILGQTVLQVKNFTIYFANVLRARVSLHPSPSLDVKPSQVRSQTGSKLKGQLAHPMSLP